MKKMTAKGKENLYIVLNMVLAILQIIASISLIGTTTVANLPINVAYGLAMVCQVAYQVLVFFVQPTKKAKIRCIIIGGIQIIATTLAFLSYMEYHLYFVSAFLLISSLSLNEFLHIEKGRTVRGIVSNIILGATLATFAFCFLIDVGEQDTAIIPGVIAVVLLVMAIKRLLFPTLKLEKIKILVDILFKTHTIDSIVGLLAFIIAFSFIFPFFEPTIPSFWDAMWYCFMVISTIGFGDLAATTVVGRIMTVILGIYGIVIVAIITSVIVNYYNAISSHEKAKDIIE